MKKFIYAALLALGVLALMAPPSAMAQEEKPFTIHGEVRIRGEYTNNSTDFSDNGVTGVFNGADSADYWPYRVRIAAEGHFAHNISTWIEFQNAAVAGSFGGPFRTGTTLGFNNGVELYQGNISLNQLWSKSFSLRLGRQEIVLGNELLLGDLDFYTGISHDGAVGTWNLKKVTVTVWATRPTQTQVGFPAGSSFFGSPDQITVGHSNAGTQTFLGGYGTWNFKKDQIFDVYLMDLDNKSTSNVQTAGARYAHDSISKNGFIWNIEGAQQFGDAVEAALGNTKITAEGHVIEGWFGYNWKMGKNSHRVYGRYSNASGDKGSTLDKNEGFIPMFGDFHNRLGHGDWFRLQNSPTSLGAGTGAGTGIRAFSAAYTGLFNDRHEFGVAYWDYKLDEKNGVASDKLGTSEDVWYGFNYSRNVNFTVSLSQLKPDNALTGGGAAPSDTVTRLYGQARLRF